MTVDGQDEMLYVLVVLTVDVVYWVVCGGFEWLGFEWLGLVKTGLENVGFEWLGFVCDGIENVGFV